MATRTEREIQLAFASLLDRVRVINESWTKDTFRKAATHVANVSMSEALRFHDTMMELNYLTPASDKRKLKPNFDVGVWSNTDAMLGFVREIMKANDDLIQQRGPKKGVPRVINQPTLNLHDIPHEVLVEELRSRGWTVKCFREEVHVIEL